jgi:N-acetylglucosaminyldiphosphoundecaprenol N-acetyl-beta-D-mannosaminyltransferase
MIDHGRHNILGIRINAVDYDAAAERILCAARNAQPLAVSALAVHGVMTGVLDRAHRHRLNGLDLLVPDGQPVRWALNLLHSAGLGDRVYGPNLMLELCRRAAREKLPIFLFGGSEAMLAALRERLGELAPGIEIAGCRASRFRTLSADERQELVEEIRASGARLVFVGIGCPRQEVFAYEHRDDLGVPLVAVGAAFAFHAALLPQAPPRMQRAGLEWLFRLLAEPKRLWRRYLLLNPLYLTLLTLQACRVYTIDPADTQPPHRELCYG